MYFLLTAQLQEIRKATVARLLCDIGDGVTEVQPRAFELPAEEYVLNNTLVRFYFVYRENCFFFLRNVAPIF